jgi:hypothetical protein
MAGLKKRKCGVVRLFSGRFWQNPKRINGNNTPHLSYISERYITIQAMSVVVIPVSWKLSDFPLRIKAKHFHQNMSVGCPTTQRYKMFGTNNTLWGIVNHKVAIFFSEKRYWFPIMLFPYSGITAYMNLPVAYKYGPYADWEAVYGVWRFYRNSYFIPPIKIRSYGLFTQKLP